MAAEDVVPPSRLARWSAIGLLILAALFLYFRHGRDLPPLGAGGQAEAPAPSGATPERPAAP